MNTKNLNELRYDYIAPSLNELEMAVNPIIQLELWLDEAIQSKQIITPNAATLATVNQNQQPSARIILIKAITENGLTFYTHYESQKGQDIAQNPKACLNFYWEPLHRQIKITGKIKKTSQKESETYFYSRPHASQAAAAISPQSQPINKETLHQEFNEINNQTKIPYPTQWGGYLLTPHAFEFWQGQPNRLHDRIQYTKPNPQKSQWKKTRLAP